MIEKIVDYIQSKGYLVEVFPGSLKIYKSVGENIAAYFWGISSYELSSLPATILLEEADFHIEQIEQPIQEHS